MLKFMKRLYLTFLYAAFITLIAACDGRGSATKGEDKAISGPANTDQSGASGTGKLYDNKITKQPCDLLTAEAVAVVAGVKASAIEQRKMASICLFTWEGGQASIGLLRSDKTVAAARTRFEKSYAGQSGEEVAEAAAQINAQIQKQEDEGKTDGDQQHAKLVTNALSETFSGGFQFEDIPGLGDISRFETTGTETEFGGKTFVSYANSLHVLTGNLKFTVSFSRDGEPQLYKNECVALARAALRSLPD
jgi:hypothetical protein